MAEEITDHLDDNLALKKKARRRLVGTIALVLISLILLPSLLTNKSEHSAVDEPVVIMESDIDQPANENNDSQSPSSDMIESASSINETNEALVISEFDPNKINEEPVKTEETGSAPQVNQVVKEELPKKEEPQPEKKPELKIAQLPVVDTEKDKPKVTAIDLEKKATTKSIEQKSLQPQFAVQLGVFADPDNVKKMQAKIALAGYETKVSTVEHNNAALTRLRVGYFVTREGAERALQTLEKHGFKDGTIVTR